MRYLMPVIGFGIGIAIGIILYHYNIVIHPGMTIYLGLASLAGLDAVFGGIRSGLEGKFQNLVFVTGLVFNALLAGLLGWFGTKIGLRDQIATAVVVVLAGRIFVNLSIIRRYAIDAVAKKALGNGASVPGNPEVARAEK